MKVYFNYFRWLFGCILISLILYSGVLVGHHLVNGTDMERRNTQSTTDQRIFDEADILTEQEEEKLQRLIEKRQLQTGCDIILMTVDQQTEEESAGLEMNGEQAPALSVLAEEFYEKEKFGYDKPGGAGILLVDNIRYKDANHLNSFVYVSGRAVGKYEDKDRNRLSFRVFERFSSSPYRAYRAYINGFYHNMVGIGRFSAQMPSSYVFIYAIIVSLFFGYRQYEKIFREKPPEPVAYEVEYQPSFNRLEEIVLDKTIRGKSVRDFNKRKSIFD